MPPIFTFTFTGIRQVDAATVESARGMGMTEARILRSVQVPLSMPLILNGIRLSSAGGARDRASRRAFVGGGGLGRFVVDGFVRATSTEVGAGVVLVVAQVVINEMVFAGLARVLVAKGRGGHDLGRLGAWSPLRPTA